MQIIYLHHLQNDLFSSWHILQSCSSLSMPYSRPMHFVLTFACAIKAVRIFVPLHARCEASVLYSIRLENDIKPIVNKHITSFSASEYLFAHFQNISYIIIFFSREAQVWVSSVKCNCEHEKTIRSQIVCLSINQNMTEICHKCTQTYIMAIYMKPYYETNNYYCGSRFVQNYI